MEDPIRLKLEPDHARRAEEALRARHIVVIELSGEWSGKGRIVEIDEETGEAIIERFRRIKLVVVWQNGMVMAFDYAGQQIPAFQGPREQVMGLIYEHKDDQTAIEGGVWHSMAD